MKILEICTVDFGLNGIPAHIRNYYNILKRKNQVDIVAPTFDEQMLKTMPLENKSKLYAINRKKNPINYFFALKKIVKRNKYDIIHVHGNSGTMGLEALACKNTGAKIFVHTHSTQCSAKLLSFLFKGIMIKNADILCAASKAAGQKLYGKRKFLVINNGIETEKFSFNAEARKEIRTKYKIANDVILLGHVGRFSFPKNQEFLIEIAKKIRDPQKYHFMLIGEGNKSDIIQKIHAEKLDNMFTILDATNQINKYYSAFDIFVFPSLFEGLGMVVIEAEYANLPCLVSDKVPKEVRISNLIKFLPLSSDVWQKNINTISLNNRDINIVIDNKFDIKECGDKLISIYRKQMENV